MKEKMAHQNTDITMKVLEEAYSTDNIVGKNFGITGNPKLGCVLKQNIAQIQEMLYSKRKL